MQIPHNRDTIITWGKESVEFDAFSKNLLLGMAAILVGIAGFMASSLWSLNEKMAVIVDRVERHETEIRELRSDLKTFRVPSSR